MFYEICYTTDCVSKNHVIEKRKIIALHVCPVAVAFNFSVLRQPLLKPSKRFGRGQGCPKMSTEIQTFAAEKMYTPSKFVFGFTVFDKAISIAASDILFCDEILKP